MKIPRNIGASELIRTRPRPAGARLRVGATGRLPYQTDYHTGRNAPCDDPESSPAENRHSAQRRLETRGRSPQAYCRGIARQTGAVNPITPPPFNPSLFPSTFDVGRSMFDVLSLFPWASPSHLPPSKVSAVRANAC